MITGKKKFHVALVHLKSSPSCSSCIQVLRMSRVLWSSGFQSRKRMMTSDVLGANLPNFPRALSNATVEIGTHGNPKPYFCQDIIGGRIILLPQCQMPVINIRPMVPFGRMRVRRRCCGTILSQVFFRNLRYGLLDLNHGRFDGVIPELNSHVACSKECQFHIYYIYMYVCMLNHLHHVARQKKVTKRNF